MFLAVLSKYLTNSIEGRKGSLLPVAEALGHHDGEGMERSALHILVTKKQEETIQEEPRQDVTPKMHPL